MPLDERVEQRRLGPVAEIPRYTLVDLRLSQTVHAGRLRITPRLDIYNMFNAVTVLSQVTAFGGTFRRPITTFSGRLFQVGARVDF